MKVLKVESERFELTCIDLVKPEIIIGNDPYCDVHLNIPSLKNQKIILKWQGGEVFDADQGSWWIGVLADEHYDFSPLASERQRLHGLNFSIESDPLHLSYVSGQFLRREAQRDFEVGVSPFADVSDRIVLRCVQVSRESQSTVDIGYYRFVKGEVFRLSEASRIKCQWLRPGQIKVRARLMGQEEGFLRESENLFKLETNQPHDIDGRHLVRFDLEHYILYLSFISEIPKNIVPLRDNSHRKIIFHLATLLFFIAMMAAFFGVQDAPKMAERPSPRTVKLKVKLVNTVVPDVRPVDPPAPKRVESAPVPAPAREQNTPIAKSSPKPAGKNKNKGPSAPAGTPTAQSAFLSKVSSKSKVGLNSPGKIKKQNQAGLLELLGSEDSGAGEVKSVNANMLMHGGVTDKGLTGATGHVAIQRSPSGLVDLENKSAKSTKAGRLVEASTTVANDKTFDADSQLVFARKDIRQIGQGKEAFNVVVGSGSGEIVQGGLTRQQVLAVMDRAKPQVRQCYESALVARPNIEGAVRMQWTVSANGRVSSASLLKSQIEFPRLTNCISDLVKGLKFPNAPSERPTSVEYTFELRRARS